MQEPGTIINSAAKTDTRPLMAQDLRAPEIMVDIIKVTKTYPPNVEALSDVSLTVNKGEMIFLTGRSGAGKTTLMQLICRVEKPTKGLVEVGSVDIGKLPQRKIHTLRRRIGMAYQDFKLLKERSVADNIAISMEVVYRKKSFIRKRTRELLAQLGLEKKYDTPAAELSRGEQQRVSIARAVANNPDIILADEPTGNLDGENTAVIMDLFNRLHKRGTTIIIATHDKTIYRESPNRMVELRYGKILNETNKKKEKSGFLPWS